MPLIVDTMFHLQCPTAARPFTWTKSKEQNAVNSGYYVTPAMPNGSQTLHLDQK
jgi:hypothetical protein